MKSISFRSRASSALAVLFGVRPEIPSRAAIFGGLGSFQFGTLCPSLQCRCGQLSKRSRPSKTWTLAGWLFVNRCKWNVVLHRIPKNQDEGWLKSMDRPESTTSFPFISEMNFE